MFNLYIPIKVREIQIRKSLLMQFLTTKSMNEEELKIMLNKTEKELELNLTPIEPDIFSYILKILRINKFIEECNEEYQLTKEGHEKYKNMQPRLDIYLKIKGAYNLMKK